MAWRVPVTRLVEAGLEDPRVKKLEKPPAESVFFEDGDELWDLAEAIELEIREIPHFQNRKVELEDPFVERPAGALIRRVGFSGDWLVWNARSELIVGRGSIPELALANDVIGPGLDSIIRMTLEVDEIGRRMSATANAINGRGLANSEHGLKLEFSALTLVNHDLVESSFKATFKESEGADVTVRSTAFFAIGNSTRVASWESGSAAWKLNLRPELLTSDGILIEGALVTERNGKQIPLNPEDVFDDLRLNGLRLEGGLQVAVIGVPSDVLRMIISYGEKNWKNQELKLPDGIRGQVAGTFLDLSGFLQREEIALKHPSSIVGCDPWRSRIIVIGSADDIALADRLASRFHDRIAALGEYRFSWDLGECLMLCRPGELGVIERKAEDQTISVFEIAPNIDATNQLSDVRYFFSNGDSFELSASSTLINRQPLVLGGYQGAALKSQITGEFRLFAPWLEN